MSAPFNDRGPFAVGEICVIVAVRNCPELLGSEVTITSASKWAINVIDGERYQGYDTDLIHRGFMVAVPEDKLRRRRPPAADSSERMHMQLWRDMAGKTTVRDEVPA